MNFNKCLKEFQKYTKNYDFNEKEIKYKYDHTLRVVEYARKICESENFTEEEKNLTLIAALLHDIARFEQWTTTKSWDTIDHGLLGYKILKEDNYILKYVEEQYANTILLVVKFHNKKYIPDNLNDLDTKILKVVRDADKIDILDTQYNYENENNLDVDIDYNKKEEIPAEIIEKFLEEKIISNNEITNIVIDLLYYLGYLYDINYKKSYEIINKLNSVPIHLDLLKKLLKDKNQYELIENKITEYLKIKIS